MSSLSDRLGAVMGLDPGAPALEFQGRWHCWGDLAATADQVDAALAGIDPGSGAPVGVLLRNRPISVGLILGALRAGACVVVLNPMLGSQRLVHDVSSLQLAVLAGESDDVGTLAHDVLATVPVVLSASELGGTAEVARGADAAPGQLRPGVAVRMLTSGTTGPPKRVDLSYRVLERVMEGAKHYERSRHGDVRLRSGVVIVNSPLVHLGGLFRVLQGVLDGRRLALLPRFTVDGWVDMVTRHQPKTVSLVPTALRMVVEATVDPVALASVRSVVSATAPLDPELAETFTARFGIPVLTSYAATEFGGGVAGWNLDDYQRYGAAKRGSVGRAHAGCELRVVDQESGIALGTDEIGLLEVRAHQLDSGSWVRTTDLARLDADGFLWIVGRADQTILRGGFKVQPEVVRAALERLPGVRAAAVVGRDDQRLGQVPVALVEPTTGAQLEPGEIMAALKAHLAPYEMPTDLRVTPSLPRTASAKVDLSAVRAIMAGETFRGT